MTRTAQLGFAVSSLILAACSGPSADMFSQGSAGAAGSGPPSPPMAGASDGGASDDGGAPGAGAPPIVSAGAGGSSAAGSSAGGSSAGGPPVLPPPPSCSVGAAEQCNGYDDDCDGVLDEGCPSAIAPASSAVQSKPIGDSTGGSPFADTCAANEILVGLSVAAGAWVDQVTAICEQYGLHTDTLAVPFQYSMSLMGRHNLAAHPTTSTSAVSELSCSAGMVMVGVRVSQQHSALGDDADHIVIPQIWIECAQPSLNMAAAVPLVVWHDAVEVGPVSGGVANGEAWFEKTMLDASQLLVGFHGATGAWIDSVGLTASPLRVLLQSE